MQPLRELLGLPHVAPHLKKKKTAGDDFWGRREDEDEQGKQPGTTAGDDCRGRREDEDEQRKQPGTTAGDDCRGRLQDEDEPTTSKEDEPTTRRRREDELEPGTTTAAGDGKCLFVECIAALMSLLVAVSGPAAEELLLRCSGH
ncbi:unnamed protein product [Calypogeia fissa]